jgi:D-alanine transaminase
MIVYLDGRYISGREACVSVDDRGFTFADGLYEVIRVYYGKPFRLREHLERLAEGCRFLRIELKNWGSLEQICAKLIAENRLQDDEATIYIQVTRGASPRKHTFPSPQVSPTVLISASRFRPSINQLSNGARAVLVPDSRWDNCNIKTIMLLPNVLAQERAREKGAAEALFVRGGIILEGTHSNFFAVIDNQLFTHPECGHILPGITRRTVLHICAQIGIDCFEEPVEVNSLLKASELFVSGTTLEITPVVEVDDRVIADGRPGQITRRLQTELAKLTGAKR